MVKWKFFEKLLQKDKPEDKQEEQQEQLEQPLQPSEKSELKEDLTESEQIEKPLAEYHETLQTGVPTNKVNTRIDREKISDQRIWRDVKSIEQNIDDLNLKKDKKKDPKTPELDEKVDEIIAKKEKHRKPSNVIYVVSRPQPGQVKGDWAVRSHGKIFSHHRNKKNAIQEARKIARERNSTVLIQNTDGTFSQGFKPRSK
jgi:hypothetical protein